MKFPDKGNWGLRILALVLAILVYHLLKTQSAPSDAHHDKHLFQYR